MEQSKVTAKIVLDTRRVKQNNTFPLKLRITFQREFKDFRIGVDLSQEEYNQMLNPKSRNDKLREVKILIQARENEAHDIIRALPIFTFRAFSKILNGDKTAKKLKSIYELMEDYITELKADDRVSTSSSYQTALNALKNFSKRLRYEDIDKDFLEKFTNHMLSQGRSVTTIGIYLRSFRTIVNKAIDLGYIHKSDYPFKRGKYQIPSGKNVKKALKISQIEELLAYPTISGTNQDRAKDLWIFSYLCNGMNVKDICRLKHRDITKNTITFIRAKTERTSRSNLTPIVIKPVKEAFEIITKWGNPQASNDTYVFPFLQESKNAVDERRIVQNITRNINKHMSIIGRELGFEIELTTYVARHSYSTVLKRSNLVSIDYISESLGHKDRKTTQHYLDSFQDEDLERYGKILLEFN